MCMSFQAMMILILVVIALSLYLILANRDRPEDVPQKRADNQGKRRLGYILLVVAVAIGVYSLYTQNSCVTVQKGNLEIGKHPPYMERTTRKYCEWSDDDNKYVCY